ncbi:folylpolyglutamate synthase/dihydrofolate synthase family protein [soil metagenome]
MSAYDRISAPLEDRAIDLYQRAEEYVTGLIMGPPSPAPGSTKDEIRARAVERMSRLRAFLEHLGNPHLQYQTIHIGGTSGKGSTTSLVASILTASGYRTGSHVSPYLQVATEKLQINGQIAPAARYAALVQTMAQTVERWEALGNPRPTYGEFWVAMTFLYFAEEAVDIAVIEVGAGGRFDLTNVIQPAVAAITSIGYDHTVTLGNTLPEIAWHKAGILKPGAAAVTAVTSDEALPVIQDEAGSVGADLQIVRPEVAFRDVETDRDGTTFVDALSGRRMRVNLSGTFQATNGALAAATVRALDNDRITDDAIARGLASARFPGRLEIVQESPLVILDGAHNPEKIGHMVKSLPGLAGERQIILVFGVLESKNYAEMYAALRPYIGTLIATSPEVFAKPPVSAADIGGLADTGISVEVEDSPSAAIERALSLAGPGDVVLVTGSLYLVGNIRERWYPTERILDQGTPWPTESR